MAIGAHGPLVDGDWLAAHLGHPGLRVLDVTGSWTPELANGARPHYDAGHLPTAVWFDVSSADGELSEPGGELPWTWPSPETVARAMDRHGITNDTTVVPQRIDDLFARLCETGQVTEYVVVDGADHGTVGTMAAGQITAFMQGQLDGAEPVDSCQAG